MYNRDMPKHLFQIGALNIAKKPEVRRKISEAKIKYRGIKTCSRCGVVKTFSEYSPRPRKNGTMGVRGVCRECERHRWKELRKNPEIIAQRKEYNRQRNAQMRVQIFSHYGAICVCCGINEPAFLTIDHINGGGSAHRRIVGSGVAFKKWIIDNGFPDGFQILCYNCNLAKKDNDKCPHKVQ